LHRAVCGGTTALFLSVNIRLLKYLTSLAPVCYYLNQHIHNQTRSSSRAVEGPAL